MGRLSRTQKSETRGQVGEWNDPPGEDVSPFHSDSSCFTQELPEETSSVWEGAGAELVARGTCRAQSTYQYTSSKENVNCPIGRGSGHWKEFLVLVD